jgi:transcriptional antiterminator RfaH
MSNSRAQVQPVKVSNLKSQSSTKNSWFCIRTHSKREHIAAAWLDRQIGIEVYLPCIRFRRPLPRGPVWFTDALFPTYLFARFELASWIQQIERAPGVHGIVRFGAHCPTVPDEVVESLRATVGPGQVHVIDEPLQPGEPVELAGGVFHGLQAVVARLMPGRDRVAVLLDLLGRQAIVELASAGVTRIGDERWRVLR